jgi:hypothetical protein
VDGVLGWLNRSAAVFAYEDFAATRRIRARPGNC